MLIVDDNVETLQLLTEALEAQEIDVVGRAMTGESAIDLAGELRPQVVLCDIRLPGMDGFAAARRIHEADPSIQIVFLTAYEELLPAAAHEVGGFAYLVKGCSTELMRDVIVLAGRRAVERRSRTRDQAGGTGIWGG